MEWLVVEGWQATAFGWTFALFIAYVGITILKGLE